MIFTVFTVLPEKLISLSFPVPREILKFQQTPWMVIYSISISQFLATYFFTWPKNRKRIRTQCNSEQILSLTCSSYLSTDRKNVISVFLPQIVATVLMSIEFAVCASSTYHIFTATRCKNTNGMQHKLFCSESVVESTFLNSLWKTVVQKLLVFGKFLGKVCKLELRHYYASVTFSSSKLFLELLYFSTILNFTCSW